MKKIALFFIVAFVCLNGNDIKYDGEFAGKADKEAYSYEKKIRIMKRIGIEYCIKGNDFGERRTDIQVLNHYLRKLGLPPYGYTITFPPPEIKSYIDDKSIIGDKPHLRTIKIQILVDSMSALTFMILKNTKP